MRIIIEDIPSSTPAFSPSSLETTSLEDGGPAPTELLHALAGLPPRPSTLQGEEELQDAGEPPAWLVEAVWKASERDLARFAAGPASSGDRDTVRDVADGGSAPEIK